MSSPVLHDDVYGDRLWPPPVVRPRGRVGAGQEVGTGQEGAEELGGLVELAAVHERDRQD